jgi:hypothetical protein
MCNRPRGWQNTGMSEAPRQDYGLKRIWIVDEGSPGHLAQARGLASALSAEIAALELTEISVTRHYAGWQRSLLRWLMGPAGKSAPRFIEQRILAGSHLPGTGSAPPDLILSSGGKSVFLGRMLANRYRVSFVFIGERKPYPSESITAKSGWIYNYAATCWSVLTSFSGKSAVPISGLSSDGMRSGES